MHAYSVEDAEHRRTVMGWICWVTVLILGLVLMSFAGRAVPEAGSSVSTQAGSIALLVMVLSVVGAAIRPVFGLYSIVFFTLIGDTDTSEWFPFVKNLSSQESLLYLSNKLTLSPLEILVAATALFWIIEVVGSRSYIVRGPLFVAVSVFGVFVLYGFFAGFASGGDLRTALFEGRGLFLLPVIYILAINICKPSQMRALGWLAMTAIFINAMLAINYFDGLKPLQREALEALGEHSASTHFALFVLFTLTLWMYGGSSRLIRLIMTVMCFPIIMVFLIAQRRAAAVAFGVGLILLVVSLAWRHKNKFAVAVPLLITVSGAYVGAFWNSNSSIGFPAQAVKSVIAPDSVGEADRGSDLYRVIENFDISFTIRTSPIRGLGFGRPFLTPSPLPDISFFEFYQYIPHNSILWIWIKMGFFGFTAMLAMFALAIRFGTRSLVLEKDSTNAAFIMMGVMYAVMFPVFAFVDIAWNPRSMVLLAVCFALCTHMIPQPCVVRRNVFRGIVLHPDDLDEDDDEDEDEPGFAQPIGDRATDDVAGLALGDPLVGAGSPRRDGDPAAP